MSESKPDIPHLGTRLRWILLWVSLSLVLAAGGFSSSTATSSAETADVGFRDFSFAAPDVTAPTGEKPQSKLWFNDGLWWGVLFNRTAEEYHIYRFNAAEHSWSDTGTLVDERNDSKADALWDGGRLYVASAGPDRADLADSSRFLRYSYDPATRTYSLDSGFPVGVTEGGMEAIVLERDTTGQFWMTYTRGGRVFVTHSQGPAGEGWVEPFVLPVTGASNLAADDISGIVSFDAQVGVMWSNQNDDAMYFATHADGASDDAWQAQAANQGPGIADDHINLKSLQATEGGRVFAAVKTSLGDGPNPNPGAPQILLMERGLDGGWTNHVFGRVQDRHTRPIVLIDGENRNLYAMATAPTGGGTIYYKETPLSNISFADGRGIPFIQSSTDPQIDDATSTKQSLDSTTDLLVLAGDGDVSDFYLHNTIDLGDAEPPPPPAPCTITGTSGNDSLAGTSGDDVICGLDGNDTIKGSGGNDTLRGAEGTDRLFGGPGDDNLAGGLGTDTVNLRSSRTGVQASLATGTSTGDGSDTLTDVENLIGSKHADTLTGDDGTNRLTGGGADDTLRGGAGNDKVVGGSSADDLFGGDDNDSLNSRDGVSGNDSLDGGPGKDTKTTDATEASIVGFP